MIYKTILTFWWQNNGTLEFRSQCHIFGWYIDIILTRCFRTIAIHLRNFLKTLEGDFKIQKENKKLYLGDSQMVNFLTRNPLVLVAADACGRAVAIAFHELDCPTCQRDARMRVNKMISEEGYILSD